MGQDNYLLVLLQIAVDSNRSWLIGHHGDRMVTYELITAWKEHQYNKIINAHRTNVKLWSSHSIIFYINIINI